MGKYRDMIPQVNRYELVAKATEAWIVEYGEKLSEYDWWYLYDDTSWAPEQYQEIDLSDIKMELESDGGFEFMHKVRNGSELNLSSYSAGWYIRLKS